MNRAQGSEGCLDVSRDEGCLEKRVKSCVVRALSEFKSESDKF